MDFLEARTINRWARRIVGATALALIGFAAFNLTNQDTPPTVSTVLGVQLTTTLPPGSTGGDDAAAVLAEFLASLNQEDSTTTRTTVIDSTTTSTTQVSSSSTTSSTEGSDTTVTSPVSTTTTRPSSTTTTTRPSSTTTTTRPPSTTTTTRPATTTTTTTTTTLPPTTTTTTTMPPTTTTTTSTTTTTLTGPIEMYVTSLTPGGNLVEPLWEPSVVVRMSLTGSGPKRDILVTGRWDGAYTGTVSGFTNPSGRVTLTAPAISADSLVFTVTSATHADYVYQPALNVAGQVTVNRTDAS
ncbi:MAG: hypothetical protein ACR2OI_13585 [Acidimicrobiia bacterium]